MHLLAATPGSVDEGDDPVDPGQTPSDVVFVSAADTELAALSEARAAMEAPPGLRLASLSHLRHPMSVDLHLDRCVTGSRLALARVLGGVGYWRYGAEQYAARCAEAGVPLALLPGDDKPDPEMRELSTVADADYDALWAYLVEGGPENAANFLAYARWMLDGGERPAAARPLLRAGLYWPGAEAPQIEELRREWRGDAPVAALIFYRALIQGAGLHPVNRLVRSLLKAGLNPLPVFVASLKDAVCAATLEALFEKAPPSVILNCTSFATGSLHAEEDGAANPLASAAADGAPVLQVVLAGSSQESWLNGTAGLSARDVAMNVALPEVDGRILSRAVSFKGEAFRDETTECSIAAYRARGDRTEFVARLAANWASLRHTPESRRRIALSLANYPGKDGRMANGVGLDTPAGTVRALELMAAAGYHVEGAPADGDALMKALMAGPTNRIAGRAGRGGGAVLARDAYMACLSELPLALRDQLAERWGAPEEDPFFEADAGGFRLSVLRFGNVAVAIQPTRGYNVDPAETYHSPDLVPPHNYLAFHFWLRRAFCADAVVHMGKHGNLEWLPGKALALSQECWPEAALGPTPNVYPFIVNDPGEGSQAKRRAQAVIVDHLTPPLTRAETYGPLRDLEALVDEYYEAAGVDRRRVGRLRREILALTAATGLDLDAGMDGADEDADFARLDAYLCELKEAQIRDGLHVFGVSPQGDLERDLAIALARVPRGAGQGGDASIIRAIAEDVGVSGDPLDCDMAAPETARPAALKPVCDDPWRSRGDTVERLELLARRIAAGEAAPGPKSAAVAREIETAIRPAIAACGPQEGEALLRALSGRAIAPGPSGAPTRGRLDVLPTGRNFYSVDSRAVPTPTAWALGWKSAALLVERHMQDHGEWPSAMLITAWGTSCMRTGGDDIAQAMALIGAKPRWDAANRRVTGFEIIPRDCLDRPRVDVTLRISGFFRDAFPQLVALFDSAARAVMELDEPASANPAAARLRAGEEPARVYGSKPGAYGAGLQAMIDERIWSGRADLAEAYLAWGSYAYGSRDAGRADRKGFEARLGEAEAIVQNQDNREHDLLDSDDYYQFEGGAAAAVAALQGRDRPIYHNDHSRPERPAIRTLEEEMGRVVRSRAVNPKWIEGVKRHGYKGAFEIAATVDYLFAFAATTGAVANHHFDLVEAAFLEDDGTRRFIEEHNAPALREIAERLAEAVARGLWTPRSNSVRARLEELAGPPAADGLQQGERHG